MHSKTNCFDNFSIEVSSNKEQSPLILNSWKPFAFLVVKRRVCIKITVFFWKPKIFLHFSKKSFVTLMPHHFYFCTKNEIHTNLSIVYSYHIICFCYTSRGNCKNVPFINDYIYQ